MKIACYPQNGKKKSLDICSAFAQGCGGEVVTDGRYREGSAAMFYGIDTDNENAWREAQKHSETHDYYYADNAYFDAVRGHYFRVTRNGLQHGGFGESDGSRFERLGIKIKPWRKTGGHILLTPQSDHFMRVVIGFSSWLPHTYHYLRDLTKRELRIREWNRDKRKLSEQFPQAIENAWALVTHSSGSAISAIVEGIPAISTGRCISRAMCGSLSTIESPLMPEREPWLHLVADHQWTLDEFRNGTAWKALQ
jgi:hypothetical protein